MFFETDKGVESNPRSTSIQTRRHYKFLVETGGYYDGDVLVYKNRFNQFGGPEDLLLRHERRGRLGCNIVFIDGHVEFVTEDGIADLQWMVE